MRQHYQEQIHYNSGDIKKTWKIINEVINKSKKPIKYFSLKMKKINEIIDQADIPNQFNKYFIELGDNLSNDIPLSTSTPNRYFTNFQCPTDTLSHFKEVSETEILRFLSNLTISKASGLDQISAKVLKIAAPSIAPSLTLIFNQSIRTGIFPSDWKVARVTPIYKSGGKFCMSNYRPISVISIVARIMEKLIHNQIYEYLIKENLLANS